MLKLKPPNTLNIIIKGNPITKKNHSQILINKKTRKPFLMPSKQYNDYEKRCGLFLTKYRYNIDYPVNVKCVYYMKTKRKVDLCNLLGSTCDILVHHKVIADDNSNIVVSHDGSRVLYSKDNPRVEITIERIKKWII